MATRLGVDIGGTGMKAALVDVVSGELVGDRQRVETPSPASPDAMRASFESLLGNFDYSGPVGIGFPSVVKGGVAHTANNIDESWVGTSAAEVFRVVAPGAVTILNDADAAALAEAAFGAARNVDGLVLVLTFGTGIGSGMLVDGQLVPNVELGSIELDGYLPAELYFSAKARKDDGLSWVQWMERANRYLLHVQSILAPELMVIGGGIAKRWDRFADLFHEELRVEVAAIRNNAGIVGAAAATSR